MIKRFKEWIGLKEKLNNSEHTPPIFVEGEIWWCHFGENVGVEVDGKGNEFTRPVLIFKKYNHYSFFGFPLTTSAKNNKWFYSLVHKEVFQKVNFGQGRSLSCNRLKEKIGRINEIDYFRIYESFVSLYTIDPRHQELLNGGVAGIPDNLHPSDVDLNNINLTPPVKQKTWYSRNMTYKETITDALSRGVAIGHFNISNIEGFWAVINASKNLDVPVIIGVSEGERDWIGVKEIKALVDMQKAQGVKVFLNADHTYSFERVKEVVDAGYDSVIIDCAKLPYEENVKITKQCVDYAKSVNPEILVEAEFGFIGSSSKVWDKIPDGAAQDESQLTSAEDAKHFVDATGIQLFAPAVGNIHGMARSGPNPHIHIDHVKAISDATKVPLVLHGGSGIPDEDFVAAADNGMAIIHISTELRRAMGDALRKALADNPDEVAPYKYMKEARDAMQKVVEERLKLFNS